MKKKFLIPFSLFALMTLIFWRSLSLQASEIPSPLINQRAPSFTLPTLFDTSKTTSNHDFYGHVTLVNVWASWCSACAAEYNLLSELSQDDRLFFYGILYKDNHANAKKWLSRGNPYRIVATDDNGKVAIDWGVYGTPELFILDKKGNIRYKQIGTLNEETWESEIKPIVEMLLAEKN